MDTTYIDTGAGTLVALGTATNKGSSTITSPWYVEAQFYTDPSYRMRIGAGFTIINMPLPRNQGTFLAISYKSSNLDVRLYPAFQIKNIRATYKR